MNTTVKKSKLLLISAIIGAAYMIYIIAYFAGATTESLGGALATALVLPHMAAVIIAVFFNVLGYIMNNRWLALASGIFYIVSLILMPIYFMFVIIEAILSFIAFAKIKKEPEIRIRRESYLNDRDTTLATNEKEITQEIKPEPTPVAIKPKVEMKATPSSKQTTLKFDVNKLANLVIIFSAIALLSGFGVIVYVLMK